MASLTDLKPNIGVYIDSQHHLWLDEADPTVTDIQSGANLREGEVIVKIRSTGICGYVGTLDMRDIPTNSCACVVQISTSGVLDVSDL
jgi:hypothetical protein